VLRGKNERRDIEKEEEEGEGEGNPKPTLQGKRGEVHKILQKKRRGERVGESMEGGRAREEESKKASRKRPEGEDREPAVSMKNWGSQQLRGSRRAKEGTGQKISHKGRPSKKKK